MVGIGEPQFVAHFADAILARTQQIQGMLQLHAQEQSRWRHAKENLAASRKVPRADDKLFRQLGDGRVPLPMALHQGNDLIPHCLIFRQLEYGIA
jgi:hypothetical protein